MNPIFEKFEKLITHTLIIIGMLFIAYQTLDLIYEFGSKLWVSVRDRTFDTQSEGRPVASLFFSILLTLEVIETVKVFSQDHAIKSELSCWWIDCRDKENIGHGYESC